MDVRWFDVAPRARTPAADMRTSTLPCWAASAGPSKYTGTFSPTVAAEVRWLWWDPYKFTVGSRRQRWRVRIGSWESWWSNRWRGLWQGQSGCWWWCRWRGWWGQCRSRCASWWISIPIQLGKGGLAASLPVHCQNEAAVITPWRGMNVKRSSLRRGRIRGTQCSTVVSSWEWQSLEGPMLGCPGISLGPPCRWATGSKAYPSSLATRQRWRRSRGCWWRSSWEVRRLGVVQLDLKLDFCCRTSLSRHCQSGWPASLLEAMEHVQQGG